YTHIGGLLSLLGFGLVLSVLMIGRELLLIWELRGELMHAEARLKLFLAVSALVALVMLGLTLFVCQKVSWKRHGAAGWSILLIWVNLGANGRIYFYARTIPELRRASVGLDFPMTVSCIMAVLLTHYLLFAKRVKGSFVN